MLILFDFTLTYLPAVIVHIVKHLSYYSNCIHRAICKIFYNNRNCWQIRLRILFFNFIFFWSNRIVSRINDLFTRLLLILFRIFLRSSTRCVYFNWKGLRFWQIFWNRFNYWWDNSPKSRCKISVFSNMKTQDLINVLAL